MLTNIIPVGDTILIEVIEGDRTTRTGLVIKGDDKDEAPCLRGKVMAISEEIEDGYEEEHGRPFPIEIGDVVLFRQFAGSHVPVAEVNLRLVEIHDVLAKEVDNG